MCSTDQGRAAAPDKQRGGYCAHGPGADPGGPFVVCGRAARELSGCSWRGSRGIRGPGRNGGFPPVRGGPGGHAARAMPHGPARSTTYAPVRQMPHLTGGDPEGRSSRAPGSPHRSSREGHGRPWRENTHMRFLPFRASILVRFRTATPLGANRGRGCGSPPLRESRRGVIRCTGVGGPGHPREREANGECLGVGGSRVK